MKLEELSVPALACILSMQEARLKESYRVIDDANSILTDIFTEVHKRDVNLYYNFPNERH